MRLPNSYGNIIKLSGNRRRPYAVRVTVGWTDDGKQIQKYISYHERRADAMAALAAYNEHPYDIKDKQITFAEVYHKWAAIKYKDGDVPNTYKAACARLAGLHDLPFVDVRKRHIQAEIDACPLGYATKKMMKTLCNQLYKYAIDAELVTINFATTVELPANEPSTKHQPFTEKELNYLWHHTDDAGARFALILAYTGLRPTELLKIKTENVHPEERYMMGGMKTAAGKNRVIPIAEKIYPFIQALYNQDNEYLVMDPKDGKPMLTYDRLREHVWEKSQALRALNKKHLPHDGRHTCASLLDDVGVNLKTIQLILGHRSANITHRVYTHKTIRQLIDAINLI